MVTVQRRRAAARAARAAVTATVLAALAFAGCGGDDGGGTTTQAPTQTPAQAAAKAEVCDARDAISKEVDTLANVKVEPSALGTIQSSATAIADELATIESKLPELQSEVRAQVQAANRRFAEQVSATVDDLRSTGSAGSAAAAIGEALDELQASYRSTLGTISC